MALCDLCNSLCESDQCRERPFPCKKHPELTVPIMLARPDRERCVQCWLELGQPKTEDWERYYENREMTQQMVQADEALRRRMLNRLDKAKP